MSSGQEVYVATAITNFERDDIPGGLDGAPRPEALKGGSFASPVVESALVAWIDLLVAELAPDFLNVGVELDLAVASALISATISSGCIDACIGT